MYNCIMQLEEHVKHLESRVASVQSLTTIGEDMKLSQLSLNQLYKLHDQMKEDLERLTIVS